MRNLIVFAFFVVVCYLPCKSAAQKVDPFAGMGVEVNAFAGKVIKHTPKFHLPVPDLSTGTDVNLIWKTYGKKTWHQRRRYPVLGIGFTYTNYGIDSIYGRCYSLYPNITIPLITWKRFEWTLRMGNGIAYVTQRYSRISPFDTMNNAIGSRINDYPFLMTDIRYHISDHLEVQAGANLSHISDASYHQPNLGINLYGAHLGIRYFPTTSTAKRIIHDLKPMSNRWLAQFRLSLAYTGSNAPLGPAYPIYIATAYASKRWISKNKFIGGIDYSYHTNIRAYLHNNQFVPLGDESKNSYKSALFVGNEFMLGRLGISVQVGAYIHQAFQTQGKLYQKLGGNLYLVQKEHGPIKEMFLCGYLKTHVSVAELAEFGFGMGF